MKKTGKQRKCVGYCRVSSEQQVERGMSLETQEVSIRSYASSERLGDVENVFMDRGVSASKSKTGKRPAWVKMMSSLSAGDCIVAVRLDRVFRSTSDAASTLEELKRKKIDLYFIDRGLATGDNITNGLTLSILSAVSQFESELKGQRIREVKQNMIANHMFVGGRRTRGFTQQKIGTKQYLVADWKEKQLLLLLASYKKARDKSKQQGERKRLNRLVDRDWSYLGIQKKLRLAEIKLDTTGNARFDKDGKVIVKEEGKLMSLDDYIKKAEVQFNEAREDVAINSKKGFKVSDNSKFSMSTLHRLLSDDEDSNVLGRLKRLREVEKKIAVAAGGEYTLLKSSARDSRSKDAIAFAKQFTGDVESKKVLKQGKLFSGGKEVALKTRIVKKKAAARA
jgi:DNA invertase Pin-like site-specific DNA recombinase